MQVCIDFYRIDTAKTKNGKRMTYEELNKQLKAIERKEEAFSRKCGKEELKLKMQYISEREPMHVKRFQRITVRLRVTEETRSRYTEEYRAKKKYQLGREYNLSGAFNGWHIGNDGQLKPCFYGGPSYNSTDEVVSVTLAKDQPCGDCSKCRCYNDGLCYMMGGKDISKRLAVWPITDDMVPCPRYDEIQEGGLYEYGERHCPNVTKVWKNGKVFYHIYSLNWNYYTEWSENEVWRCYTKEPKKETV